MKRVIIFSMFFFLTGCYSMKLSAPEGKRIEVATPSTKTDFKKTVRVWYAGYGLIPLSDNNAMKIIAENRLKNVRLKTKVRFSDGVWSLVTGWLTVVPATMIVEGTRERQAAIGDK